MSVSCEMKMMFVGELSDLSELCGRLSSVAESRICPTDILKAVIAYDKYSATIRFTNNDGKTCLGSREWGQWVLFVYRADCHTDREKMVKLIPVVEHVESPIPDVPLFIETGTLVSYPTSQLSISRELDVMRAEDEDAEEWASNEGISLRNLGPRVILPPHRFQGAYVIIDTLAIKGSEWVIGANDPGYYYLHFNWMRDLLDVLDDEKRKRIIVANFAKTDAQQGPRPR